MYSGIYTITSPSGSRYVGSAVNFVARERQHFSLLRNGKHYNKGLQRACKKYGIENLVFRKLLICSIENLIFFEQRAIDILRPKYNACPIAGSPLGRNHSIESKAKNAAAHLGRRQTPEQKIECSRRMMGNLHGVGHSPSPETRMKLSIASSGPRRFMQEERRELAELYRAGAGLLALCALKKTDHRTIRRALVAEGVQIRAQGENGPISDETRAKYSAAGRKKHSEETKKLMSEAALRREAKKRQARAQSNNQS